MEHKDYNASVSKKSSILGKTFQVFLLLIVFALTAFFGFQRSASKPTGSTALSQTDQRVNIDNPTFKTTINKSFSFPLKDQSGTNVSEFVYTIESVELRDQIVVKGQEATAIKGKRFLIINIKVTNKFNKTISVNARDYLRVSVDNSSEKTAPDLHSDPVEIQPISTKSTRLGLTVDDTVKNITLQVGEIAGKKETIPVALK